MSQQKILALVHAADAAINRRDFDTLVNFYDPEATLVLSPQKLAHGRAEIRAAFDAVSNYFNHSLVVTQGEMRVVIAGNVALVIAETRLEANQKTDSEFSMRREANYVYRKNDSGDWLCIIDNSYGAELLAHPMLDPAT